MNLNPNCEKVPQELSHRPKIQKLPQNYTISIKKPAKLLYNNDRKTKNYNMISTRS